MIILIATLLNFVILQFLIFYFLKLYEKYKFLIEKRFSFFEKIMYDHNDISHQLKALLKYNGLKATKAWPGSDTYKIEKEN